MKVFGSHATQHLTLDKLVVNRRLARRLPPGLAFRYHALPVAKDNGDITVAMADPDNRTAREAIATALGTEPYVVQGDSTAIDKLLAEVWPQETKDTLRLLVYHQASPIAGEVQSYAQYLSDLLGGQLNYLQTETKKEASLDDLVQASCDHALVIFGEPDQSLIRRLLSGPMGCQAAERVPTSVLIARRPRWPLRKILFVTRGQGLDDMAVDWMVRLAQPSRAAVTVLAVVPAMSAMCQRATTHMPHGVADWLTTDTPLGRQLRRIARRLVNWEIEGKLRFRQGTPDWQIESEVAEENYDLIVIATDPDDWWLRRLLGELVSPLLHWIDRPVLIAKSTTA